MDRGSIRWTSGVRHLSRSDSGEWDPSGAGTQAVGETDGLVPGGGKDIASIENPWHRSAELEEGGHTGVMHRERDVLESHRYTIGWASNPVRLEPLRPAT